MKNPKYAIRIVRSEHSAMGAGSDWLCTAGWKPLVFRSREDAVTQMELCQKHTRSPFVTYYVDEIQS